MIRVIWPERISLKYWADSLVSDYSDENLPTLTNEEEWQKWGALVAGTGIFQKASIPSPISRGDQNTFKEWNKWAKAVYAIMSDEYNR